MNDPEIVTDFLAVTNVRASPIGAISENGVERVVMIEVYGTIGGDDDDDGYVRLVFTKDAATRLRGNLDKTLDNWGVW